MSAWYLVSASTSARSDSSLPWIGASTPNHMAGRSSVAGAKRVRSWIQRVEPSGSTIRYSESHPPVVSNDAISCSTRPRSSGWIRLTRSADPTIISSWVSPRTLSLWGLT